METIGISWRFQNALLRNDRGRTATRDDSEEVIPSSTNTARVTLDEILQGNRHGLLHRAGIVHVTCGGSRRGRNTSLVGSGLSKRIRERE